MSYFQNVRQFTKGAADTLNDQLEKDNVKKIKRVVMIIFATLLVLDIIFVIPVTPFPTISKVVLFSSPKNLFIIWLWGVATSNVFLPRTVRNTIKTKLIGFIFLIGISIALFYAGRTVANQSSGLKCEDSYATPASYFTEIICYNDGDRKIDCTNASIPCAKVRVDITILSKVILLVAGMFFGYFLWPQYERKASGVSQE